MTHRIATIIPYYQREAGILTRAMQGVLAQDLPAGVTVHVFVIDDSSPRPAADDLSGLVATAAVGWSVHRQPNAGPGAARNTGLDLAEAGGFDTIAFLDSDDVWLPGHLAAALAALDQGYGFYFCDNSRDGAHDSYAASVPALQQGGAALRDRATVLSGDGPVLGFAPGALAREMVAGCLCHTSAVVARTAAMAGLRFDAEQRTAGEDHFFWINVAVGDVPIAISWASNVVCGRGVNIFFAAFDWNTPATLERVGHLCLLFEKMARWDLAADLCGPEIRATRQKYRRAFGFLFLRTLLRGRRPGTESLRKIRRLDPLMPLRIPFLFLQVALDRRPEARVW